LVLMCMTVKVHFFLLWAYKLFHLLQELSSPTFFEQLFLGLNYRLILFWFKEIGTKGVLKILV
jgi:hypothetical protein